MSDEVKPMADDDVTGGIVTTVKKATTSDLDVLRQIEESKTDDEQKEEKVEDDKFDAAKLSPAAKKEFDTQAAHRRRTDKKLQELEAENNRLKAGSKRETPAPESIVKLERPTKPDATKFATPEAFAKAEEDYEDKLYDYRKAEDGRKAAEAAKKHEDQQIIASFNDRAIDFAKEHPDYTEVMDTSMEVSSVMFGAMLEEGPQLGYYFAKNPDETKKIMTMSEREQIKAVTRIIVKLELEGGKEKEVPAEPKPKTKTEPPAPVGSRGAAPVVKDRSKMTFKEKEREYAKTHPGALNYTP